MTRIKLCGLSRLCDIETANKLKPDYIGFVFAPQSRRYITPEQAAEMKRLLDPGICAVGVFTDETPEGAAELLNRGVIDMAQLHGSEDEAYIRKLRKLTDRPMIRAFQIKNGKDAAEAEQSQADYILLDSGAGTGTAFNWDLIKNIKRSYFLAGGLDAENVPYGIKALHPFAVDVSSGIETDGKKDYGKMAAFVAAVRKEDQR